MTLSSIALVAASLALATDSLPSAVYHAPAATRPSRLPSSQPLLKGSTLDLKELEITTSTLSAGQASRPQPAGAEALLIVQAAWP